MSQLARDLGKRKEPALWKSWGGPPTSQLLRHGNNNNKTLLRLRHKKLETLIPALKAPTEHDESVDPTRCDEIYEAWTLFLIEKTRSNNLIFKENCNYGFRRNLWGMKPIGVVTSCLGTLLVGSLLYQNYYYATPPKPITLLAGAIDVLLVVVWACWITPGWIRIAANAYAERLLAATDSL
jgi:hypothetical protein